MSVSVPCFRRVLVKLEARAQTVMPFSQSLHRSRIGIAIEDRGKPFHAAFEVGAIELGENSSEHHRGVLPDRITR